MSRKTKSKLITSLLEILLFVCISFIIIVPLLSFFLQLMEHVDGLNIT